MPQSNKWDKYADSQQGGDKWEQYADGGATETTSTGITVPKGMIEQDEANSEFKGFFRRGMQTLKGAAELFTEPPTTPEEKNVERIDPGAVPVYRVWHGIKEGAKEAGRQAKEQFQAAGKVKGDPVIKGLGYARAGVTAASALDPLATGSVTNINQLSDEGRHREAIGAGAFDALTLLIGKRTGRAISEGSQVNKLVYATDAAPNALEHILPDLKETITQSGRPKTVNQLFDRVQGTMKRLDQKFNSALTRSKGNIDPSPIADELESKAQSMPPSYDGKAMAQQLKTAASQYRKPWTMQQLNAERMLRNGYLKGFYKQGQPGQMAALRSSADTIIDKVVSDGSKDILYDEMDRQFPGQGFRELKQKQSSLIDIMDSFDKHVDKLEKAQALKKGSPLGDKASVSATLHPGGSGLTPRISGLKDLIPGRGPMTKANAVTRSAFGPSTAAKARRAAILSLPLTTFVKGSTATVPAPPEQGDQE